MSKGGFRKEKSCLDQILLIKMLVEEYLGKDRKLHAAIMDLEKEYGRVEREPLWNVLKIHGVGGQLMEGMKAFYRKVGGYVKVDGELSDSFAIGVGVR